MLLVQCVVADVAHHRAFLLLHHAHTLSSFSKFLLDIDNSRSYAFVLQLPIIRLFDLLIKASTEVLNIRNVFLAVSKTENKIIVMKLLLDRVLMLLQFLSDIVKFLSDMVKLLA